MPALRVIYQPKGRAAEYAPLALNTWHGCVHGCRYPCYAAATARQTLAQFAASARPRTDILARLERDAADLAAAGDRRPVHLCFMCDPYQPAEAEAQITRRALGILTAHRRPVSILTKAGDLARRDFDLLTDYPGNQFGATITGLGQAHRDTWEPRAALPEERITNLAEARAAGLFTWVSLEPPVNFEQAYAVIEACAPVVNHIAVGRLNHNPRAGCLNWPGFREQAVYLLEMHGFRRITAPEQRFGHPRTYYIKTDLEAA